MRWSKWQRLPGWSPPPHVLGEVLDGGQSFRWHRAVDTGIWTGTWSRHCVQLRSENDAVEWRAPAALAAATESALLAYLGADRDWEVLSDALPWRSDAHLAVCRQEFAGLRVLRQPFGETLLCFLCSATKQIVQIKQMVALLAERHGRRLLSETEETSGHASALHPLPTWGELAAVPEAELRGCLLGFRARFIAQTAQYLAARPGWLEETAALPYAAAKIRLMELPGVGEKVADCVLLFGAGKLEAFPVDTWILKSLERRYGLAGWRPAQVAQFGRAHFGPLAGYAQQFLFAWERAHGGR